MALKRFTIELDDSEDVAKSTAIPESTFGKKSVLPVETQNTGVPSEQESYREIEALEKGQIGAHVPETVGRTPSDLFVTYINRPHFIATALTCIAFVLSVSQIKGILDFWLPIVMTIVFNSVWFGVLWLSRMSKGNE